jgi:hypothetical protein
MLSKLIADNHYIVYEDGRIWSIRKNTFLKPQDNGTGYLKVSLRIGNKSVNRYIHRLVAEAFIPNPNNYPEVNHIDADKTNNDVNNLEWCTSAQNKQHASYSGLMPTGEHNGSHKLTEYEVKTIRKLYRPNSPDYNTWTLAKMFGVSQTAIRFIINGTNWKGVNE